jgi:hypothetical protein
MYSTQRLRIGDWLGIQLIFSRNKSTVNEQIVEIIIHSSIDNFQSELPLNSEQKLINAGQLSYRQCNVSDCIIQYYRCNHHSG